MTEKELATEIAAFSQELVALEAKVQAEGRTDELKAAIVTAKAARRERIDALEALHQAAS